LKLSLFLCGNIIGIVIVDLVLDKLFPQNSQSVILNVFQVIPIPLFNTVQ